jgi:hypothetical protein
MHPRAERLALVREALSPLVQGSVFNSTALAIHAATTAVPKQIPAIVVRPGREQATAASQGTSGALPTIHRRLPIDVTVIERSEADRDALLAAIEAAIPWTDAATGAALFELGDTTFEENGDANALLYAGTLQIVTKYQAPLGQV